MLCYSDGRSVEIGDAVDFDGEAGTVIEILDTEELFLASGMDEPAVGFQTDSLGAVYQSPHDPGWDGIVLLSRKN